MAKLKGYMKAYNLPLPAGALEKDDFIDIIIKARVCTSWLRIRQANADGK
jgi:hypothetical protein